MRKLGGIIESPIAPPTNMVWLYGNSAKYFSNGKWVNFGSNDTPEGYLELETKVDSLDKEVGKIKEYLNNSGIIELEVGNSKEVMARNLVKLETVEHQFQAEISYGYGVASWVNGDGGEAHILTAEGIMVFYNIGVDGSVTKISERMLDIDIIPVNGVAGQILKKKVGGVEWGDLPKATKNSYGMVKAATPVGTIDTVAPEGVSIDIVANTVNMIIAQLKVAGIFIP